MNIQNKLAIQKNLLAWFQKHHRKLKFRETKNPYHIWVSEVMLQQTRVKAMLPSYEAFISRFPSVESLASSDLKEVFAYWKGLGYYSRAENLHKGAKYIAEKFGGKIPNQLEDLLKVPGIGVYTASAILSIAHNVPVAVLDGNVKRVLSRVFLFKEEIHTKSAEKKLQELANEILNLESPGDHNQALMELGALVCTPKPNCFACPILENCEAKRHGMEKEIPLSKKQKEKIFLKLHFIWIEVDGKVLLTLDNKKKFFKKIYTLPFWIEGKNLSLDYFYKERFFPNLKISSNPMLVLSSKHFITNHSIDILVHSAKIDKESLSLLENFKLVEIERLDSEFPSSITKKILQEKSFHQKNESLKLKSS